MCIPDDPAFPPVEKISGMCAWRARKSRITCNSKTTGNNSNAHEEKNEYELWHIRTMEYSIAMKSESLGAVNTYIIHR